MIQLHSLRKDKFALNPALVERIQEFPNTTIVLVDGTRVIVDEPMAEVEMKIIQYNATVLAQAWISLGHSPDGSPHAD